MKPFGKLIITGILLLAAALAHPQEADSLSVNQLLEEASALSNTDPDSALIIVKDAYGQALDLNNAYLQARANCLFGNIFAEAGSHDKTLGYYFKALDYYQSIPLEEMSSEVMSQWGILLTHITDSYFELDISAGAYDMVHMRNELSDSIYSGDVANQLSRLSFQNQIAREIHSLNLIHEAQLDTERKKRIVFMFIGLLLLLLLLVTGLYARQKQGKAQIADKMHQMEADRARRETGQLIKEMESQKKELTEKAMYVIQQNELIANIASRMQELSREFPEHCGSSLDQMVADLGRMQDDNIWKEFEHRFRKVHEAFYEALNKRFPDLTSGEKKLAAFLRLNLSTKDISAITQQSPGSIKVSRSRLRNKLGLTQKENLITFLESIEK